MKLPIIVILFIHFRLLRWIIVHIITSPSFHLPNITKHSTKSLTRRRIHKNTLHSTLNQHIFSTLFTFIPHFNSKQSNNYPHYTHPRIVFIPLFHHINFSTLFKSFHISTLNNKKKILLIPHIHI